MKVESEAVQVTCSLCRFEFTEAEGLALCGKCALLGGCRFIRCPRCGYEMPRTPGLVKWVRGWAARRAAKSRTETDAPAEFPLARLGTGGRAVVVSLQARTDHERSKLMALGLLPGASLKLLQKFPSYVVVLGHTQLALDKETAALISVRPEIPARPDAVVASAAVVSSPSHREP